MKVITSIYLNCRPDLRDEWLTGNEVDDMPDAQVRCNSAPFTGQFTYGDAGSRTGTPASHQVL